jgi:hypothetical protein
MALFVGLDVSLRTTSICVVEANGSAVWEGKAESEPRCGHLRCDPEQPIETLPRFIRQAGRERPLQQPGSTCNAARSPARRKPTPRMAPVARRKEDGGGPSAVLFKTTYAFDPWICWYFASASSQVRYRRREGPAVSGSAAAEPGLSGRHVGLRARAAKLRKQAGWCRYHNCMAGVLAMFQMSYTQDTFVE